MFFELIIAHLRGGEANCPLALPPPPKKTWPGYNLLKLTQQCIFNTCICTCMSTFSYPVHMHNPFVGSLLLAHNAKYLCTCTMYVLNQQSLMHVHVRTCILHSNKNLLWLLFLVMTLLLIFSIQGPFIHSCQSVYKLHTLSTMPIYM